MVRWDRGHVPSRQCTRRLPKQELGNCNSKVHLSEIVAVVGGDGEKPDATDIQSIGLPLPVVKRDVAGRLFSQASHSLLW